MLFHVAIRHDAAHCPGFHTELMPRVMEGMGSLAAVAEKFGVEVHGLYNALPDHVEFFVGEADSPATLAMFLSEAIPYGEADTETHAVVGLEEMLAFAEALPT